MNPPEPITLTQDDLNHWHEADLVPIRDWLRLHEPKGWGIFGFTVHGPEHVDLLCSRSGQPYIVGGERVTLTRTITRPRKPFPMDALPRSLVDPASVHVEDPPL